MFRSCVILMMLMLIASMMAPCHSFAIGDVKKHPERQSQYEELKSFSPSQGEDVKYNSVSTVLQLVKKEISDADPTLLPVKELRRIFFDTLIAPVQKFETEFNDILSDFILLREQFKDYIEQFLEFNSVCFIYLDKFDGTTTCFDYIPILISYLERMDVVLHRIISRDEFDKRLNAIQKIVSSENMKIQNIESDRIEEYDNQWFQFLKTLDVRGLSEAKDQLLRIDKFLLDFSGSFNTFRTYLKLARNQLYEAHTVTTLENRMSSFETSLSRDGLEKMLNFLWDVNYKSYKLMRAMVHPDTSQIVVKLPVNQKSLL